MRRNLPAALDAEGAVALERANKTAKLADRIRNAIVLALLVVAITFSVLGYLRITGLIAQQNQHSAANRTLLTTLQADDKILKTATGPGTVAASTKQIDCIINRLDHDTSLLTNSVVALDKTCPTFTKP